jgi:quercetin dioxygenase-like cupin family protein
MMPIVFNPETQYQNLLENCAFESDKPVITALSTVGSTQVKRVALKAGTALNCHKTEDQVLVLWIRGKAKFTAHDKEYVMHPGSMLEMPSGTPHGAVAETDCVFAVFKFKSV